VAIFSLGNVKFGLIRDLDLVSSGLFTLVRSNLYKIKDFYHVTNVGASSPKAHLEPMTILHVVHN
jgi:hypothetical protein